MSHLADYLSNLRQKQHLSYRDLAIKLGYANLEKGCRRIQAFEDSSGETKPKDLPQKLASLLGADPQQMNQMIDLDKAEWEAWLDEPVPMRLIIRYMAVVCAEEPIPATITTPAEAEAYAKQVAVEKHRRVCLVVSRRLSVWIDEKGEVDIRTKARPDRPNEPYMQIGSRTVRLHVNGEKKPA